MLGFYNYTVYLTYIGLLSAIFGIYCSAAGDIKRAAVCLLFSGLCDMFDGKIARTKKDRTEEEKNFGIQIDSLCDTVCFGVLPAAIFLSFDQLKLWQVLVAGLFVLCGIIRLGYFNVTEEARQKKTTEKRSAYSGLPITASAVAIPLVIALRNVLGSAFQAVYCGMLALLGICYITPFNIKKPGVWGGIVLICAGIIILGIIFIL